MKIAIVARNTNILPSPKNHTWAPGITIANEANVLFKHGQKITVYCAKGSKVKGKIINFNMPAASTAYASLDPVQQSIRIPFYNNIYNLKVIDHLRKNPVDIIHIHDYRDFPLYKQANLNIPIVVTLHGDFFHNFEKTPTVIKDDINHINVIAIGNSPKIPKGIKSPIAIIPNIQELQNFKFFSKPKDRVVYVGRIIKSKGPDLAIEAAKIAEQKIGLYGEILGDDEWKNTIHKLLNEYNHSTYHGFLPHSNVNKAFDAKALILPMREPEGFGNVVTEAMVSGTPVITYGLGGTADLIKEGINGFLVKPGDIKGLANAIRKVDKIDRQNCRNYTLNKFDKTKAAQKLIETFQIIIKKSNKTIN